MKRRTASVVKPLVALLAVTMLAVALACASEEEPTAAPTVAPTATSPAMTDGDATATPIPDDVMAEMPWMEQYLQSPGYDPAWGEPVRGGTFIFGAQRDNTQFVPDNQGCCYNHGCFRGLPWNSLLRIDAWTGDLLAIEGDLAESWEMASDGLSLTLNIRPGIMFFDEMSDKATVPAEFNGGQILGDEFVCEDAAASYNRYRFPPENVKQWLTQGRRNLNHLESTSCPDGPRGHTFVMHFSEPLAKTLGVMAGDPAHMLDKDYVAWLKDYSDREDVLFGRTGGPGQLLLDARNGPVHSR